MSDATGSFGVADPQLPSRPAEIEGLVDGASATVLRGWARNRANRTERLSIELRIDGRVVMTALADKERSDLVKHSVGDGRCAFECRLQPEWAQRYADLSVIARAADGTEQNLPLRIRRPDIDPSGNLARVLEATSLMHRQILEEVRIVGRHAGDVDTSHAELVRGLSEQVETLTIWLTRLDERLSGLLATTPVGPARRRLDLWQLVLAGAVGGLLVCAALGTYFLAAG
jgi:hypothetical protein